MQVQLACVLLLCVTCGGICSELDSDQRALAQEILSSLFPAKMRQSKQSAPFWRVPLSTLCRVVNSLDDEGWSQERAEQEVEQEEAELSEPGPAPPSEELYGLRVLCRMLQNREQRWDSVELVEDSPDVPLRKKAPYILKRQTTRSQPKRPYILKRSPVY